MRHASGDRIFSAADQERFAALSGDWNPIHLDPVYARRTAAGATVVHGIHLLLHMLEQAAAGGWDARNPTELEASFNRFVLVGETTTVRIGSIDAGRLRLELLVDGAVRSEVVLRFGGSSSLPPTACGSGRTFDPSRTPLSWTSEEMAGLSGSVAAAAPPSEWEEAFPAAARWLGTPSLTAFGASSRLVGMIGPGLNSLYTGLSVALYQRGPNALCFKMGAPRHGLIRTEIAGGGIVGALTCLIRAAPHRQPRMVDLAGLVPPEAFSGSHALIVGGSRGLGEVTAKLLASGGAAVTLTYARGATEAHAVAEEIGPGCAAIRYDVADPAATQLAMLVTAPSHVYYFATPQIARPTSRFFDPLRLEEMLDYFVRGFWDLALAISQRRADARLFYPSTTYVAERVNGMAEYAMAKAAGEVMCAEIERVMKPLSVISSRLPQLATDQTLTIHGASGGDVCSALLPIVRAVQCAPG